MIFSNSSALEPISSPPGNIMTAFWAISGAPLSATNFARASLPKLIFMRAHKPNSWMSLFSPKLTIAAKMAPTAPSLAALLALLSSPATVSVAQQACLCSFSAPRCASMASSMTLNPPLLAMSLLLASFSCAQLVRVIMACCCISTFWGYACIALRTSIRTSCPILALLSSFPKARLPRTRMAKCTIPSFLGYVLIVLEITSTIPRCPRSLLTTSSLHSGRSAFNALFATPSSSGNIFIHPSKPEAPPSC
mmetsp:Transcript_12379/g.25308  ORF Transcript_12379/g.25308 Transcript_12379/m.25308 type:complete len:250 (-) Transcript_12379:276-1025(-)